MGPFGGSVPEVIRAVLISHEYNGDLGIIVYQVDAVGCFGEEVCGILTQALECRFAVVSISSVILVLESSHSLHQICLLALEHMALHSTGLLCLMVECKAGRALDIVVSAVSQGAVRADDDLLTASRKLHGMELLLVVLLECGAEVADVRGY